ncbi:AAA domain-containing protein [Acinetobacter baumannii]
MKDYKILNGYIDKEKIYKGKNYDLYKVYRESSPNDLTNDECFFIKIWSRLEQQDDVIKEIWLDEVRQLQALKNYPNSEKYLLVINNAHYDDEMFSITYECDENDILLSVYLEEFKDLSIRAKRRSWLFFNNLIYPNYRIKFWQNILNIIYGLDILHQNGLLHRKISPENIIIRKENDIDDFRLTGFEWLLSVNRLKSSLVVDQDQPIVISSYNEDWYLLGELIESLLMVGKDSSEITNYTDFLTEKEKSLIEKLKNIYKAQSTYRENYFSSQDLIENIKSIIFSLENEVNLENNEIKEYDVTINRKKLEGFIEVVGGFLNRKDLLIDELYNFIKKDIDLKKINIIKSNVGDKSFFFLQGNNLIYEITPTKVNGTNSFEWNNIVLINNIYADSKGLRGYRKTAKDFSIKIKLVSKSDSMNSWLNIINSFKKDQELSENVRSFINTMLICYSIEVSEYWTKIFKAKIQVNLKSKGQPEDNILLNISPENNNENLKYAIIINKPIPTLHFKSLTTETDEKEWILSNKIPTQKEDFHSSPEIRSNGFSEKNFKVIITLKRYDKNLANYYFVIKNDSKNPNTLDDLNRYIHEQELYIYPKSLLANYTALLRRNYTLEQVAKNSALISSIMHMETSTSKLKYPNNYVSVYNELDSSKQKIYREILDTYPNYIVQGPPGVGKTFLVTSLLEQIFTDEPDSKVVLSAQSHATVQVLYDEIKRSNLSSNLMILDTFNNIEDEIEDKADLQLYEKHTEELWSNINQSEMWKESSKYIDLKEQIQKANESNFLRKSLHKHVLSSANIVLATSNSSTIETISRNNNQFDWTILEESGKASGLELLSPLLLSSKRLLIGDHKQLPPFSENTINKILLSPNFDVPLLINSVSKGIFASNLTKLSSLNEFSEVAQYVKDNLLNDNSEEFTRFFTEKYHPVIDNVRKYFSLFQTLVKNIEKYKRGNSSRLMGDIITEQYRMHPNISQVISTLFYNSELTNNPKNEKKYLNVENRPFLFSKNLDLPDLNQENGFVWLDISDPNKSDHTRPLEVNLSNDAEVEVIRRMLETVQITDVNKYNPSIVILTPYKNQIIKINEMIHDENLISKLQNKGFHCGAEICKTVDSFQGGEADLVIVSLVRHNINKTSKKSLGFLLDERRLNVMFSRAKYQMFVVGSIGMFEYWAYRAPINNRLDINEYQFIDTLCKWVQGQNDVEIKGSSPIKKLDVSPYITHFFSNNFKFA